MGQPDSAPDPLIRVLVADDHRMARAGLCMLLRLEPDVEIVGEANDGYEALTLAGELRPHVLLADISMPGPGGIELARQLRDELPDTHVVVLTMHEDANLAREALEAGAYGYIVKRAAESDLIAAVRAGALGEVYVDRQIQPLRGQARAAAPAASLTQVLPANARETELLRLLAQGLSMQQVSNTLGISPDAAEPLRQELLERLGLRTRVEIMRYVRDHGLLDDGPG